PTQAHYEEARNIPAWQWILTESLRTELYFHLFIPTGTDERQPIPLIFDDIIRGKITVIRELQHFMLHFVKSIENAAPPNLRCLVDDAVILIKLLKHPLTSSTHQTVKECNPFHHFWFNRCEKWTHCELGFSDEEINKFWENY